MRVVFHDEASAELAAAAEWYERRRRGLGDDLLAEVDRAVMAVGESPHTWPPFPRARPGVRRFLLSRFPFAIIYVAGKEAVLVIAFAHNKRTPRYWVSRVGQ
jgi:plasmid stabilization system protein ParE